MKTRMSEIKKGLKIPEGTIFTDTLLKIYKYNTLNKIYSEAESKDPLTLIESLLKYFNIHVDFSEKDINNIPLKGPFIAVSNNPYRGIDSMILYWLIRQKRPDIKVLGNHLLAEIEPLNDVIIPVTTRENLSSEKHSIKGIRSAFKHLSQGNSICIFPAIENIKQIELSEIVIDREWDSVAVKLIKNARVPVVPVYFHATMPRLKYFMGKMLFYKGASFLPSEILNKKNRLIKIRIGSPISLKEQLEFHDFETYGRYLRARVYSLGIVSGTRKIVKRKREKVKMEPVIEACEPQTILEEFKEVRKNYELFTAGNFTAICAPSYIIPNIFREIGRLREITFREVGEGTGKGIDIDRYDFFYQHLFLWDNQENRLAGAYRLGKGREIMLLYGIKGFYISSLFRIKKSFSEILSQSIELGRSFIVKDYQRKTVPLFLLWKGIMVFLLRHPEYRYLIGPVSISNDLSGFSKSLIFEFIKKWFFNYELARHVKSRREFVPEENTIIDRTVFVEASERDINKIEKIIIDAEAGYRMPVLLKKYIEINGEIIGFNIDPKFNNCLDGLMILDLYKTPRDFIAGLSREMNDPSVMERFSVKNQK